MASGFKVSVTDLDSIFKARSATKRADVGFVVANGQGTQGDISNRYEKSAGDGSPNADQIGYNTGFRVVGGTDLRYYFQSAAVVYYTLTVSGGTGGGTELSTYTYTIIAGATPANKHWDVWTSAQSPTYVDGTSSSDSTAKITISEDTTVTATYALDQYTLTVTYGSGDGTFDYNAAMAIVADAAPANQHFSTWINPVGSLTFDNANAASTNAHFASAANATAEATYAWDQYTLTVIFGTGGGTQDYGYTYNIVAGTYTGYSFSSWDTADLVTFGNQFDPTTTCTIGAANATVEAVYVGNDYTLTVVDGTGGGTAAYEDPSGHVYTVTASTYTGWSFTSWQVNSGSVSFANQNASPTTCTIGAGDATIESTYTINQYTLTVVWGTGGGTEDYGNTYNIVAGTYEGYVFTNWQVNSGSASFGSSTSASTTCTIGAGDATVEAVYDPV